MFVIAHLSDPHLDGTEEARQRLRRITSYLREFQRPVDVVLVTGDLADHALPAEYDELAAELEIGLPVLVLPGNHDASAPLRLGMAAYVDSPGAGHPVHQVRDVGGARFVLVDSSVPGEDHGLLSAESLGWLDGVLREPVDGPLFVAFHHPPFVVGHPVMDAIMMQSRDAFEEVLRDKPITALLAGHIHDAIATTFAGHPLLVAPGVRSSVPLPFEPPPPAEHLVDLTAHPGLALHIHTPDAPLKTLYRFPA